MSDVYALCELCYSNGKYTTNIIKTFPSLDSAKAAGRRLAETGDYDVNMLMIIGGKTYPVD